MSTDELDSMLRGVASAPSVRPPPRIGDRLGDRYVIEAFLGEGGMGTVYRALDEKLGESVALKLVRRTAGDALRDEVRLAQKVTHANVCRTFDLEDIDGHHVVKMEYVAGETLAVRLRRDARLPIDEVVRIARAIADGLAAAHAKQIVHGDLKPGNVMLDGERVVLMDFGIARHVAAPLDGVRGTVGYIAPELVRDQAADGRADYYALGCLVYEMLAGEPVFGTGAAIAIAARHVSEPVFDMRAKRPDTPRWLARAVTELLAKRPGDRTAGVSHLHAGPRSRARVIAPIALAVVAIAAVTAWRLTRTGPTWVAEVHDYPVFQENMDQMTFSPTGEWLVFGSDRDGHGWHAYVMSRATGDTTRLASPPDRDAIAPTFTRDGMAILYGLVDVEPDHARIVRQPVAGVPPRAIGPPEELATGELPEDCGDAIVYKIRSVGGVRVMMRLTSGEQRQLYTAVGLTGPACDPSGQRVVVVDFSPEHASGGDVAIIDRSGNVHRITNDHVTVGATFAADGQSLIVSRTIDNKLQLFELAVEGGTPRRLLVDQGPDAQVSVSRDGRYLAFTRDNTSPYPVLVSATGAHQLTKQSGAYRFPQFITDALVVVQVRDDNGVAIAVLRVDDGTVSRLAAGKTPFPSLDHTAIYFESAPGVLSAISTSGGAPRRIATLPGAILRGNAGPDGEHVLVKIDDQLTGYLVRADGRVESDRVRGLVSAAPTGGWRAVTLLSEAIDGPIELALVKPGAALEQATRRLPVVSIYNRWLDDHRISYCLHHRCEIYDVATDTTTRIEAAADVDSTVAPDENSMLHEEQRGTVTRHLITNFDQR